MNLTESNFNLAVENLYSVFSKYPFRAAMPCCIPHCLEQSELDVLGKKSLPEITPQEIQPFAEHLLLTCGVIEDLKFVLPRLLELSATGQLDYPDCEVIFGKLAASHWLSWEQEEMMAIQAFLKTWWLLELNQTNNLETAFAALCCTEIQVQEFLVTWRDLQPVSLANFVNQNLTMLALGKRFNAYTPKSVMPSILEFLQESETRAAFEQAFYSQTDASQLHILSLAEQLLA